MSALRTTFDWSRLTTLRLRARAVADGLYAGAHRSSRRGSGVEFGGHRAYAPGDDLRRLDRRALLRHDRLVVREFETETDRALRLVVDATASMGYRGSRAPASKLEYAGVLAAALARLAMESGDPVGLTFFGGSEGARNLPVMGGREAFERVVGSLETVKPGADALRDPAIVDRSITGVIRAARRGSAVVVFTDLLDLEDGQIDTLSLLGSRGRVLSVVQLLDPDEAEFPFDGPVRLVAMEGNLEVETDPIVRDRYLEELGEHLARVTTRLISRGARVVAAKTNDDPVQVVRAILHAFARNEAAK